MGSSSLGWEEQDYSLHISVLFRPLVRHVHSDSFHDLVHLQFSNCNTASGGGKLLIHSITSFPSSSVIQPLFGICHWGLGLQRPPPYCRPIVSTHCMHEEAILTQWELTWFCFTTSSTKQLVTKGVHICCVGRMHIHAACELLQFFKKLIKHIPRTSKLTEGLLIGLVRLH